MFCAAIAEDLDVNIKNFILPITKKEKVTAESPIMKWLKQNAADLFNTVVNASQIASSLKKKSLSGL